MPAERTQPTQTFRPPDIPHSPAPARCQKCFRSPCTCTNPTHKPSQSARVRRSTRHSQQLPPIHLLIPALAVKAEIQSPRISPAHPLPQSVSDLSLDDDIIEEQQPQATASTTQSADPCKWRHPAELEYIEPRDWDENRIISYLCTNAAFSLPTRDPLTSSFPWVKVYPRNPNEPPVTLPRGYRIPLMFSAKFMWESLKLVLESPTRTEDWEECKFDILHVARLCSRFLGEARKAEAFGAEAEKDKHPKRRGKGGMSKAWRCATFDRTLIRYYRRWLVSREEFVRDFWVEFDEEEFECDVLGRNWSGFAIKGHKGFHLTKEEIQNGISFEEFTKGLTCINGRWSWDTSLPRNIPQMKSPSSPASRPPAVPALPRPQSTTDAGPASTHQPPHQPPQPEPRPRLHPPPPQQHPPPPRSQPQPQPQAQAQSQAPPQLHAPPQLQAPPQIHVPPQLQVPPTTPQPQPQQPQQQPLQPQPQLQLIPPDSIVHLGPHRPPTRTPSPPSIRSLSSSPLSAAPSILDLDLDLCSYARTHSPSLRIKRELIDAGLLSCGPKIEQDRSDEGAWLLHPNVNANGSESGVRDSSGTGGYKAGAAERPIVIRDHGTPVAYPSPVSDVDGADVTADGASVEAGASGSGVEQGGALGLIVDPVSVPVPGLNVASGSGSGSKKGGSVVGDVEMDDGTGKEGGKTLNAEHQPHETETPTGASTSEMVSIIRYTATSDASTEEVIDMCLDEAEDDGTTVDAHTIAPGLTTEHPTTTTTTTTTAHFLLIRNGTSITCGPSHHAYLTTAHPPNSSLSPASPVLCTRFVLVRGGQRVVGPRPLPVGYYGPAYSRPEDAADLEPSVDGSSEGEVLDVEASHAPRDQRVVDLMRERRARREKVEAEAEAEREAEREREKESMAEMGEVQGLGKRKRENGDVEGNGSAKRKAGSSDDGTAPVWTANEDDVGVRQPSSSISAPAPPPVSEATKRGRATTPLAFAPMDVAMDGPDTGHPVVATDASSDLTPRGRVLPLPNGDDIQSRLEGDGQPCDAAAAVDSRVEKTPILPSSFHASMSLPNGAPSLPENTHTDFNQHQPQAQHKPNGIPVSSSNSIPTPNLSIDTTPVPHTPTPHAANPPPPTPKITPKHKPQYTKSWNERVAAAMESARQVRVRGHEGDGDVDGFLEMMERLKVPEHEPEPEPGPGTEPQQDVEMHEIPGLNETTMTATIAGTSVPPVVSGPPPILLPVSLSADDMSSNRVQSAGENKVESRLEPMVLAVQENGMQGSGSGGDVLDENMAVDGHEISSLSDVSAQPNVVDAKKYQREAIVIQPTITSDNKDGAVIAQDVTATIGVVDRDMTLDGPEFSSTPVYPIPTGAVQDKNDKASAQPATTEVQHDIRHDVNLQQTTVTAAGSEPGRETNVDPAKSSTQLPQDHPPRTEPPNTLPGTSSTIPVILTMVEKHDVGTQVQPPVVNLEDRTSPRVSPPQLPSPSIPHTDSTLVDRGPTPPHAPIIGSYHQVSQLQIDEEMMTEIDPNPVLKKVVSMFRNTLAGLTDILETVGGEDAKMSVIRPSPSKPSAPASPSPSILPTSQAPSEPDAPSTSLVITELLSEIKSLRRQMQEEQEQKEERDKEVKRIQNEIDQLRHEIGMFDLGAPTQSQTNDDDGIIDMDISPISSTPASPSSLSTPTAAWRKKRFRDLGNSDRTRSPHPLAHLLAPTLLPLRIPLHMPMATRTPLVPSETENSHAESIASTPVTTTPTQKELPPSSKSLRTPSPVPKPVSYDGVPLPIKSQRKQRMFFQADRQQN